MTASLPCAGAAAFLNRENSSCMSRPRRRTFFSCVRATFCTVLTDRKRESLRV
nr:MAG TPA: hypothetical protein [Caudoviricetes sp.]